MALHVIVTAKQVIDPDMPLSAMRLDADARRVVTPATLSPVVNGFDEVAVEAALRLKDNHGAKVTVLSVVVNSTWTSSRSRWPWAPML